jgi:hypothetical protein
MSLARRQHPLGQETGAPQRNIRIEAFAIDRVDGSRFVASAATVPGVPQKSGASRSAEEQLGASDDSCRQPALPRSVMAGTDAFACRYLPGLRRRTGDVIDFLCTKNGTLPALRPPSTRFWRD